MGLTDGPGPMRETYTRLSQYDRIATYVHFRHLGQCSGLNSVGTPTSIAAVGDVETELTPPAGSSPPLPSPTADSASRPNPTMLFRDAIFARVRDSYTAFHHVPRSRRRPQAAISPQLMLTGTLMRKSHHVLGHLDPCSRRSWLPR